VSELNKERDDLAASLVNLEAEHANLIDSHDNLKCVSTLSHLSEFRAATTGDILDAFGWVDIPPSRNLAEFLLCLTSFLISFCTGNVSAGSSAEFPIMF